METKEDHIKCFIDAYKNNNIASCNFELLFLILSYNTDIKLGLTYNHNLKHLLFQTNCIRNPMGFKYTIEDYDKYNQILYQTIKLCKAINNPNVDTTVTFKKDLVIDDKIIDDITDIWVYTYCLYKMNSVNSQRMDTSKISQIPFVEQLLSIVLFYEDQTHILKQNYQNGLLKGTVTGLEMSVADKPVEHYKDLKISILDNFESLLENANEILRYLYYKFGNTIENSISVIDSTQIRPYQNKAFEEYIYIATQRQLLCRLEENIRYGYHNFCSKSKTEYGSDAYIFSIENNEKYKAKCLGIYRREYKVRRYSMTDPRNLQLIQNSQTKILSFATELITQQSDSSLLLEISNYHPDINNFKIANESSKIKENLVSLLTKEYYLNRTVKSVKITDLLTAYSYLYTLSEIIYFASIKLIDKNKQSTYLKELSIVETVYLINELSRIYGFELDYSKELIERFIFHESNNKNEDIFSQPLLKISKTEVILSPALIDQVNLDRFIERQFIINDINISPIGHDFENKFCSILQKGYLHDTFDVEYKPIPNFLLNNKKIEYTAFDGKSIEFDVVSVLGDYLILTELKAIMTSYGVSELDKRKHNIDQAIKQLHRRKDSIKHDWAKFKEKSSINLPESPYDEDHIILIACTDAYDFTPLKEDDVYITDDSTYLKYFTSPYVDTMEISKESIIVKDRKNIWSKGYPNAEEFKEYLLNPVTIHPFSEHMQKEWFPIPRIDKEDIAIAYEEIKLTNDPIKMEKLKY